MANRFSDYLTPDEFAQLMKTNPTAVTGNRELEAIAQFKAEGGKLKGDLPQPPAASLDSWGGGFDHAEAAQKLMDDVENAETNLDYDVTKEPWVGKAFNNTIEKIKDTQLYAQYMYSPEDWADKGKEIFDVTGIDVNNLNDKELFNKAWNVTKEYKKKAAIYADENGHVNMDKVYEAMPYLRDIHEAHGTSAAVQVMRSAKQLQTINDLYDSEGARFLASLGYGAKGAAMQAGLQVYGAKAMLNGLLFGEQLTDKQANDIMWFQKQLESMPEFSYTSVGGAVGGALGSAVENAPIMLPEMARTAAVALGSIPAPMAKALGVAFYAAMSTQIAGQQYIDNLLKTDENGNPIYTPRQAALLSLAQGFVEGALEKRSIATAGKAVFSTATATKLSEIYAKDVALAEGQTLSGATREAISNVVKERVRHGIKAGGVSFGAELEEEFEQKVSDMVLENMAQIAVRGDKADVASVGKILEDSFAEAAEAIPAVAGFSLLGVGGAVVNDAKTIHDTRKRFINSRANSIMNNYYINDEMKNILHGVADNLDNIADLEAKAPEVVEQILDTQNEKVGLKEVEVDIGELKQIGQTDVIDTIAKKANVSQEELMACLNGTGRLTVAFSKLQMATRELSDEGKTALDNNVSTVGGVTDRENKENVELLKMIADTMKKRTDEETSEVVSQFVQGTYADEETRKLAKEIIEADLSNPYEEVKRRQRDVASLIDEYLGDTIAQMKAEGGQGVDIIVGEDGKGTRASNNPQWYRNFYADFGRAPTNEDYERLAYEFETGQATRYAIGSYGEVTPEEAELFKEKQKLFDELFAERERLKNIQQSLEGIKKDDFLAYASLPVEARQVYHVFADALSKSDSADVRKSATANAIIASMIAHRVAEARRAHGENVSDIDVIPNIGSKEQGELKQFAGQKSLTANTEKLAEAMSMEQAGATSNEIYKKTGWLKGKDGGWRYEIKDKLNSIDLSKTLKHKGAKLSDVYDNKELFDAYPQLKDIQVSAVNMLKRSYGETLIYDDGRLRIHINKNRIDEELELKTTIVHEIAHCIQAIEGFANGASPSDVKEYLKQNKMEIPQGSDFTLYERIAGEQEAREVEKRARATMLLENKDKAIEEGDTSKKAKFARKVLAQAANRMPVPHKADAIVILGDVGVEVSANVEAPSIETVEEIPAQMGSGSTQVAGTTSMYVKALAFLRKNKSDVKNVLDYGAGLGLGTDAMREANPDIAIDSYEPNPERWRGNSPPNYTDNKSIDSTYDAILNTNVLNVVEPSIRDMIVRDIGRLLNPNGTALITTRAWKNDIDTNKNYDMGDEYHSMWVKKTINGKETRVYQKGFDGNELVEYVKGILGDGFDIKKVSGFGKSSVLVTKKETPTVSAEKAVDEFLQSAWHGTPHKFDSFDLGKIGTGEGAQAHGWGLYFAQSREVAEGYKERLGGKASSRLLVDGKEVGWYNSLEGITDKTLVALVKTIRVKGSVEATRESLAKLKNPNEMVKQALKYIDEGRVTEEYDSGSLFEVDIPNDDVLLDEQKEFKEQPSKVKEAVRRCLRDIFPSKYNNSDIADMFLSTADSKYRKLERSISGMLGTISQMEDWLEYFETGNWTPTVAFSMDDDKKSVIQKFRLYPLNVKESVFHLSLDKFISTNYDAYAQELAKVPQEEIDAFDVKEALREGIEKRKKEIDKETKEIDKFFEEGFDKWFANFADGLTGKELYRFLDECMGSDKNASTLLNDYGVEGIAYVGHRDGRCFVVFNDTAINIINTYNQKINGETKGSYSPTKHMLTLFKTADQSTFMHEMSHFYLSELMRIAKIDENSTEAKMLKTITDWAEWHKGDAEAFKGTASYNEFSAYEKAILEAEKKGTAKLNDKEYTKEQLLSIWVQEKFARGFETYLQSGEAPTTGLKRIFARFKQWLKKIYLAYTGAGVEPSSDVKAIMARMVATDEAIAMASVERKVSVLRDKLGDDVFEKDTEELREKWLQEAEEEAKAKLLAKLIKQQKDKNIDEHMKAYEETIREQLTEENAFVVQALIEEGFTEEEAITGIYPSVDVWKKDLEAKGGSFENAISKAVETERERYKQEMPSEEELRDMAEEELITHTTELEAMEAEILERREKKYNELPAKVTNAIAEMDEALEFEESDNPLKLAMTKLKYAYRWNEQQKAQIEDMQKQIDALKEKSAEEKKHLKAELKANLQAFKENTLLNKNWLRGVRDATKGKVKEIRAFATNNLMTMPIREATDTKRFIGEARKEAKTVLAKLTKAISGNKQTKISLSTETALSNTMQEAGAEKDNSTIHEAYYAKIREAVYVEQARQSVRIKQGVEKMKARLTRIGKSVSKDKKAEFDASAHYYIGHILYMTGITKKDARRPQTLVDFDKFINALMNDFEGASENETVDYNVPSWLKELAMSKGDADDYRAYRFSEMQDLTTLIVNIYTTARNEDRLFTSDKKASEVQKEMLDDYKHTVTAKDGFFFKHDLNEYYVQIIHPVRFLETLGGSYKKYIYDILAEANEKKKAMQQVAADGLNALFDKYWDASTRRKLRSKKDYVAPNGQKLSKENILVMALNWGNTGNRIRVINTFSANIEDEGEALRVKSEIEKLFEDVLTARDWQFVQDVWQFIGAYGDRVSMVVETETGTPMKRVEAEPFEIATSDGLLINVDGGYYPIAYDTENATGYIDEEGVPSLSTAAGANGVFNANMGSTKDRSKEGVVGGKIRLDMDKLFAHVNQQIHIATMRLAWRDAYKLIKSRPIRETIVQTYGAKTYDSLKAWVESCWSTPIRKRTWVEELTDKLRQRTVTAIMAYRVSTSLLNFANPVYMAREMGNKNAVLALIDYYGNLKEIGKKRAWVKRQSSFMRNRAHNLDRDFNRTKTDSFDRGNPVRRLISQFGNYIIEETDLWFSIPTYYWTYKQAYNEELGKGTSNDNAKKIAHRKAEDTVRRIFGSSEVVDQSEVQRSKSMFMKAMTPFYTFASTQANHLLGEYLKSKYQGYNIKELEDGTIEREKKKFYKTYWGMFWSFVYTYVLGAFVEQAIREAISYFAGDDKDKKEKLKRMKQGFATRAIAQGVQSLGSGFPMANIIASLTANEILGETYGASNFGMIDAAYSRFGTAFKKSVAFAKGKTDALEAGRAVSKAILGAGRGIPDTFVDAAFNGARAYVDHYSVEDWFRKSLFDKKLKKKGK